MGEVIDFLQKKTEKQGFGLSVVAGEIVRTPTNGDEYIEVCRKFLSDEQYTKVLSAIFNAETYYNLYDTDPKLVNIVDSYYTFVNQPRPSA